MPFGPIPEPSRGGPLDEWRIPVVRVRTITNGKDPLGYPLPAGVERAPLPGAIFEQVENQPLLGAGVTAVTAQPNVYWPGEWPDVQSGDELEVDGGRWLVDERPVRSPLGLRVSVINAEPRGGSR